MNTIDIKNLVKVSMPEQIKETDIITCEIQETEEKSVYDSACLLVSELIATEYAQQKKLPYQVVGAQVDFMKDKAVLKIDAEVSVYFQDMQSCMVDIKGYEYQSKDIIFSVKLHMTNLE